MGIIKAFIDSVGGSFADQWKELITAGHFDEHTVVAPGILKTNNNGRGVNSLGSTDVISNGSKIFIPENTAAFIFSQAGIEGIITTPGGYEYRDGEESLFDGNDLETSIFKQTEDRIGFGGISSMEKKIAFVNLREIRDIKFGTRGPQVYNDLFYGCDLEIYAYGSFSIKIVEPKKFIKNFVPANVNSYSFDNPKVRAQVLSEFLQSFIIALNSLSTSHRISQLPSQAVEISKRISNDSYNAGTWKERFGFELVKVAVENIEFSPESRQLINQFSANKMNMRAYEDVSQRASNIAAQQKIAQGIQNNGLGNGGGMLFGMNMAQNIGSQGQPAATQSSSMSFDEQIETLKKLKDLVDMGVLTQAEFDAKKKEIMGL
ncbi:SPFH domain-containing protein [Acetobacterium wieringae]|uniref:SPFH domain-containing protein n=1 Tax=Acetobacterium wieringae TaxID=52694 RepID=UPI0020349647|nr:SPFH domain-containing protein [Acetobacterium wieringae]URN86045.1 SPFH domain-containing protein [Acetobacterium wieringae]